MKRMSELARLINDFMIKDLDLYDSNFFRGLYTGNNNIQVAKICQEINKNRLLKIIDFCEKNDLDFFIYPFSERNFKIRFGRIYHKELN